MFATLTVVLGACADSKLAIQGQFNPGFHNEYLNVNSCFSLTLPGDYMVITNHELLKGLRNAAPAKSKKLIRQSVWLACKTNIEPFFYFVLFTDSSVYLWLKKHLPSHGGPLGHTGSVGRTYESTSKAAISLSDHSDSDMKLYSVLLANYSDNPPNVSNKNLSDTFNVNNLLLSVKCEDNIIECGLQPQSTCGSFNYTIDTTDFNKYAYYRFIQNLDQYTGRREQCLSLQAKYINDTYKSNYYSFLKEDDSAKYYAERLIASQKSTGNDSATAPNSQSRYATYTIDSFIDTYALNSRYLILNEAHHINADRIFALTLLKSLKSYGYNYLAVEDLDMADSSIWQYGMPSYKSGYYVQSTEYANLLRMAIKLGYKIIAYDPATNIYKDREIGQATNLYNLTLAKDTGARVVVYCGYDHLLKDSSARPRMAYYLKKIIGDDPLTISQTTYYNHYFAALNPPDYAIAGIRGINSGAPMILKPMLQRSSKADFEVYVPNKQTVSIVNKTPVDLSQYFNASKEVRQVLLFFEKEYDLLSVDALPIENIELKSSKQPYVAYLDPGSYKLVLLNDYGQVVQQRTVLIH